VAEPRELIPLGERIVAVADGLGIKTALIGAVALAAHHYVRGTQDIDLASNVDPNVKLVELERAVRALGLHTKLRLPDDDDDLGGVLDIAAEVDADGDLIQMLQIVNFYNPHRPRTNPGADAVKRSVPLDETSNLRCVRLDDLIALKLYSGSRQDLGDVVALLERNPDADLEQIRTTCAPYDFTDILETLISEASAQRS
jgi:hypothetical protein